MPTHSGVCKGDSYLDSQKTIGRGGKERRTPLDVCRCVSVRVWVQECVCGCERNKSQIKVSSWLLNFYL